MGGKILRMGGRGTPGADVRLARASCQPAVSGLGKNSLVAGNALASPLMRRSGGFGGVVLDMLDAIGGVCSSDASIIRLLSRGISSSARRASRLRLRRCLA